MCLESINFLQRIFHPDMNVTISCSNNYVRLIISDDIDRTIILENKISFLRLAIPSKKCSSNTSYHYLIALVAPSNRPDWNSTTDSSKRMGHNVGRLRSKSIDISSKICNCKEGSISVETDSTVGNIEACLGVCMIILAAIEMKTMLIE